MTYDVTFRSDRRFDEYPGQGRKETGIQKTEIIPDLVKKAIAHGCSRISAISRNLNMPLSR